MQEPRTFTFTHRMSGERLTITGFGAFPLMDARHQLADITGYPDDWQTDCRDPESECEYA